MSNPIPRKLVSEVYERDNYTCQYCLSTENLQIHHIVAAGMGSKRVHEESNLVTLCVFCHALAHSHKAKRVKRDLMRFSRKMYGNEIDKIEKRKWRVV